MPRPGPALPPPPARQGARRRLAGGLATLATLLALLTLAAWAAAFAQRAALHELRASANHLRAAEAFEAAQGGLDWALALLQAGPVDAACLPAAPPAASLAERLAQGPVEAACRRLEAGWACQCTQAGPVAADAATATSPPGFRVTASRMDPTGVVHLRATGHGAHGSGQASVSMAAARAPGPSADVWRRVAGSWRDF